MIGAHRITSGIVENNRPTPNGTFDSGLINTGGIFPFVFDKAGKCPYYYTIDSWMTGMVIVS
jgi:hypothetical protein